MALTSLRALLADCDGILNSINGPDREITAISLDSRTVGRGCLFFAIPGTHADGLRFAPQAIQSGAVAIVCEHRPEYTDASVEWIVVRDVRAVLAHVAAKFYPRQPATVTAVTGTSGKTSVAAFVRQIWLQAGFQAAALGTTGLVAPGGEVYGSLTTPDPVSLHRSLDELADSGVTHLAMEASSHGLHQKRLDGVRLTAGAFTNLSRDHMDYHKDFDDYLAAKMRLFESLLQPGQTAVVNTDSDVSKTVLEVCRRRGLEILSCGEDGILRLVGSSPADDAGLSATRLEIEYEGKSWNLLLPLAGAFMASNALVAAGLCMASGMRADDVFAALEKLEGAPGRLEKIGSFNGAPVFVDYAHKPDALEKVLQALRPLTRGRLAVVFGCGGDRDKGKRPIMGTIAAQNADTVYVTDDNPRSENAAVIRKEILDAAPGAIEIGDRAEAIKHAVAALEPGDLLVVAGKGHEKGQIIGDVVLPFSDHDTVREALSESGT